ncbi:MAG: nucleotide sugar dehydrogenase [Deltaproteobacteria bacterium]|nr:nucleotide sugar dehydrogenase [Deltaproteobacteria bacterium]
MITFEHLENRTSAIGVVGLGYVGLPLAVALSEHFRVVGFDISALRIEALRSGRDSTLEVDGERLSRAPIEFTADPSTMAGCGLIIVAVPTPIDGNRRPDLGPVQSATTTVGRAMSAGSVVVYESTVYPGVTEDVCVPILETESGLSCGTDFKVGYSPERINPGDRVHTLETIVKIVAGQDPETADLLARVYGRVVTAGIHRASSIKVAEAAKVIENTQRDLNIALMNELAQIFDHLGIDTLEVLQAAGSKWNFLPFRPGLVGGHCIGVDPYYLTFLAESLGFHPQVILAGRRINDGMAKYVAERTVKELIRRQCRVMGARVGVLGLTFKENVPDLRNSKVADLVRELRDYGVEVLIHDPLADPDEARREYTLDLVDMSEFHDLDGLVLAVGHDEFKPLAPDRIEAMFARAHRGVIVDIKAFFDPAPLRDRGLAFWRL